ncbi:hypothetical protein MP638_005754 [Amoeboaphelidium occidentale]|nr:hypothetical protein MP638_005754 [Amoeboaphelidium occidentale]
MSSEHSESNRTENPDGVDDTSMQLYQNMGLFVQRRITVLCALVVLAKILTDRIVDSVPFQMNSSLEHSLKGLIDISILFGMITYMFFYSNSGDKFRPDKSSADDITKADSAIELEPLNSNGKKHETMEFGCQVDVTDEPKQMKTIAIQVRPPVGVSVEVQTDIEESPKPQWITQLKSIDEVCLDQRDLVTPDGFRSSEDSAKIPEISAATVLATPDAPPPPAPPPMPSAPLPPPLPSALNSSPVKKVQPKYRMCPLSIVPRNPNSLFSQLDETILDEDLDGLIGEHKDDFRVQFGLKPARSGFLSIASSPTRRDSGIEDGDGDDFGDDIKSSPNGSPKKPISVIDDRKQYTLDLTLKQMRLSIEVIESGILKMDLNVISLQIAKDLVRFAPNEQEVMALEPYAQKSHLLLPPDRFMLMASGIPDYTLRLEVLQFLHSYKELIKDVGNSLDFFHQALVDISENGELLEEFVKQALKLALFMNQGRAGWMKNSSAWKPPAFRIRDILKFEEIKPNDMASVYASLRHSTGKIPIARQQNAPKKHLAWKSLFHFFMSQLSLQKPKVAKFYEKWHPLRETQVKDIHFKKEISLLKEGMSKVKALLASVPDDCCKEQLSKSLKNVQAAIATLSMSVSHISAEYTRALVKLNEISSLEDSDAREVPPEEFFNSLYQLVSSTKAVNETITGAI